ncbi:hypothetical protein Tco_1403421 [Tanacetum coccineum]
MAAFWKSLRTAEASTDTDGKVTITAIIDGQSKTITEASLRRHLKLEDHDGLVQIAIDMQKKHLEDTFPAHILYPLLNYKTGKSRKRARVVALQREEYDSLPKQGRIDEDPNNYFHQDDEVVDDVVHDTTEERQPEDSIAGITVSTAPINISTDRETHSTAGRVVYGRRSKEARKDKGKEIMTEPEPEKKSKKLLEQERQGLEEAIRLQEQVEEKERLQVARVCGRDKQDTLINLSQSSSKEENMIVYLKNQILQEDKTVELDDEKEDLKGYLDIVPREDVAVDVDSLSTKYPIMDCEDLHLSENVHAKTNHQRDGSSQNYNILE